ncbi:uncharacterized protein LOC119190538 isoform X1 [Manduca sexta]|uniref:uncharacterized protein LOC119190538 isoform X1 n=1 Tax=Manduca sexta TaxID=7130 RepID=UPI00188FE82D|nr:uncharacterized protein LOC119190538 isoform X1 [Manduca sexta]
MFWIRDQLLKYLMQYIVSRHGHTDLHQKGCVKTKNFECISNYFQAETKTLCAIFGHKIALYLNKPMAISLTPRLERISKIVSDEIWYLLRKKISMNKTVNQKILYETAAKVSVWMELILEETTYKLQEDELADLEEEIGPILDLIDDLVENALEICVPDSLHSVLSVEESKQSSLTEEYEEKAASEISFRKNTWFRGVSDSG